MSYCRLLLFLTIAATLQAQEKATNAAEQKVQRTYQLSKPDIRARQAADRLTPKAASQIDVQTLQGSLKDWNLTDLEGQDVKAKISPRLKSGQLEVRTGALQQFIIKPKKIETHVIEQGRVMELPGGIVMSGDRKPNGIKGPITTGNGGPGKDLLDWLRLTFFASPLPAEWDPVANEYTTRVTFGLKLPSKSQKSQALEKPITVVVSFDGLVGDTPPVVKIGGAGLENEQSFDLKFRPTTARPTLRVRSSISDANLELRAVSRLALQSLQSEILGFGLEQATFSVQEVSPHGTDIARKSITPVNVSVKGRAKVEPKQPSLQPNSPNAQFKVRSAGLGDLEVQASIGDSFAIATVRQTFPFGPIIAALIGGALGGYGRRFMKGARSKKVPRWITEGAVVALIAFVAGVLGVGYLNLPAALVATEAGAFLTGAIAGFAGVAVLEKLSANLSRSST